MYGVTQHIVFYFLLLSRIHLYVSIFSSFLLLNSIPYYGYTKFVNLLTSWSTLALFSFFPIMNIINIHVQGCVSRCFHFSWINSNSTTASSYDKCMFNFTWPFETISKVASPSAMYESSRYSISLSTLLLILPLFKI